MPALPVTAALLFTIVATGAAQLLLKLAVTRIAAEAARVQPDLAGQLWIAAREPVLIGGLMLYGLATVSWLFVLSRLPLSFAYPFVGLSFLTVMAASVLILGEPFSALRLTGTLLVAIGVVLVAASGSGAVR